ncbi:hypothetical protein D5039_17735 [Verminephrobacter aporrectodeae subsp. tuberculatae]|uniref:Uncharacterized protein n=1 Tax=Verminephrobacter aporrectodeae subsp. tuberculatae TaxID=1110392 RepID=A0ABT3KX51_9BURK|nr:hypothetical protein [Verminephrobacter aporrectodeae subsp. tuberculatae]
MDFSAAISGVTAGFAVLKGAIAARDDAKIKLAQQELQEKLQTSSTEAFSLVQKMHALESEVQELRTELARRSAYTLVQPAKGIWVNIRGEYPEGAPEKMASFCASTAYFCPTCWAENYEVPLQCEKRGNESYLICKKDDKHELCVAVAPPRHPSQRAGTGPNSWMA